MWSAYKSLETSNITSKTKHSHKRRRTPKSISIHNLFLFAFGPWYFFLHSVSSPFSVTQCSRFGYVHVHSYKCASLWFQMFALYIFWIRAEIKKNMIRFQSWIKAKKKHETKRQAFNKNKSNNKFIKIRERERDIK